jgi:hypothetical protein
VSGTVVSSSSSALVIETMSGAKFDLRHRLGDD